MKKLSFLQRSSFLCYSPCETVEQAELRHCVLRIESTYPICIKQGNYSSKMKYRAENACVNRMWQRDFKWKPDRNDATGSELSSEEAAVTKGFWNFLRADVGCGSDSPIPPSRPVPERGCPRRDPGRPCCWSVQHFDLWDHLKKMEKKIFLFLR